jgi:hypothetical protein
LALGRNFDLTATTLHRLPFDFLRVKSPRHLEANFGYHLLGTKEFPPHNFF